MKNYLVTAFLKNLPQKKNTYFLGMWCHEFTKNNILNNFGNNTLVYHWKNKKKLKKDYKYLSIVAEKVLRKLSNNLNKIHNTNQTLMYWRIVLYPWISQYTAIIFDRWEVYNSFLKKHKNKKFYFHNILSNKSLSIANNHEDFLSKSSMDHQWNHKIFHRIFYYLKPKKIISIVKNYSLNIKDKKKEKIDLKLYFRNNFLQYVDKIFSFFAFRFNSIIFDTFYFPKKEYLKLCLRNRLIPSRYISFFKYNINNYNIDNDIRFNLHKLFFEKEGKTNFINFLLNNIHKDIPKSYLENFELLRDRALKLAKKKKIIFSMHSMAYNDFFRIYIAETKKKGSKLIMSDHGGGFVRKLNMIYKYYEKISDKKINWDNTIKKKIFLKLSPTLPIITRAIQGRNRKNGFCTIVYAECSRYQSRIQSIPFFDEEVDNFANIIRLVKGLNSNIKNKIKFRVKGVYSINSEKIFSDFFGKKSIDPGPTYGPYYKSLLNSRMVIIFYPQTSFSESMFLNVPTILICKKETMQFEKSSLEIFKLLKKNKMAFENFNEAKLHINKIWSKTDQWWNSTNVQKARSKYLNNFFCVKPNWYEEWSNYIKSINNSKWKN